MDKYSQLGELSTVKLTYPLYFKWEEIGLKGVHLKEENTLILQTGIMPM